MAVCHFHWTYLDWYCEFLLFFSGCAGASILIDGVLRCSLGILQPHRRAENRFRTFFRDGFRWPTKVTLVKDVKECLNPPIVSRMHHFLAAEVMSALETASQDSASVSVLHEKGGGKNIFTNIPLNFPQSVQSFIQFQTKAGSCWRICT